MTTLVTDNEVEPRKSSSYSTGESVDSEPKVGVKQHISNYSNQVQDYLNKVDAKIDGFKFTLEKHGEELTIDLSFRATIHPKNPKPVEKTGKKV
jgi:hypothetical protein